ncbi:uncharacterized protein LOC131162794 [Malania oleifera]|uniref:uncharacterized protein LOC131162794 n=1 Tax=Malania oleifera TaxID=397392 RepID=UPI0025AEB18E|nr:uncharacterized protein LOC131162794 [Malania oleifera]
MWGFGGRYYWERAGDGRREGIVVAFAWMCSEERHLKNYVQLYSSLGWDSLVCHSSCLNMFVPAKATSLAFEILDELVKELRTRRCPIVFASFSGGPKACMYKVLQIIEGNCEAQCNLDGYRLVKDCISGYIYDSSPSMGAPYLILCSEIDNLASYQILCNFSQRLQDLGANVKFVKLDGSPHVGHYRIYPSEYRAAVTELLGKATLVYSQRLQQLDGDGMGMRETYKEISRPTHNISKAAACSSHDIYGLALEPYEQFLPSSMEPREGMDIGSAEDEQKEGLIHCTKRSSAEGVLDHVLPNIYFPKNVEGWEMHYQKIKTMNLAAWKLISSKVTQCCASVYEYELYQLPFLVADLVYIGLSR